VIIDQAEEIDRGDFGLLFSTLRGKIKNDPQNYKFLMSANPAQCWLLDIVNHAMDNSIYIPALPSDNPYLPGGPSGYIETLKISYSYREELLEAYLHGNWQAISGHNLVIHPRWVDQAISHTDVIDSEAEIVTCDPARYGDDLTVMYVLGRGERIFIKDQMIYGQRSTMETAGHLVAMKERFNARLIIVDEIGIGAGICDRLRELHQPVMGVNSGNKPQDDISKQKYANIRAQMWWEAAQLFADEKVKLPNDHKLRQELINTQYEIADSRGLIKLENKEDIKKRMGGKSPDRADAFVMGLYGMKFVSKPTEHFRRYQPPKRDKYGWQTREAILR
jgi:hypothetical protein